MCVKKDTPDYIHTSGQPLGFDIVFLSLILLVVFTFFFYICSILVDPVGGIARPWAWGFRWLRNKDRSGYPPTSHSNSILQIDIKKEIMGEREKQKKIFPKAMDLAAFERSVRDSRTDTRYLLSQSDKICSFDTRIMNIGMMR